MCVCVCGMCVGYVWFVRVCVCGVRVCVWYVCGVRVCVWCMCVCGVHVGGRVNVVPTV